MTPTFGFTMIRLLLSILDEDKPNQQPFLDASDRSLLLRLSFIQLSTDDDVDVRFPPQPHIQCNNEPVKKSTVKTNINQSSTTSVRVYM
jgi:hypothetical protein